VEISSRLTRFEPSEQTKNFRDTAVGMVSTRSFPAIVGTADMMLKSSGVTLIGFEKIGGGHCTAIVRGGISDVRLAVESGVQTAEQFGQLVSSIIIPRPMPNLEMIFPMGSHLMELLDKNGYSRLSNQAIGLLETRGFPAMVGAADAMLKSADVYLSSYELIGDGLCTAIIRGTVANVAVAVEAGMLEAERIGELHAVMVIPRPLDDLEKNLPAASCWIEEKPQPINLPISIKEEKPQPINLPISVKEVEKEFVELPDLAKLPVHIEEFEE
jgi:carbon dioxide concentrating mechanism protein CcmO